MPRSMDRSRSRSGSEPRKRRSPSRSPSASPRRSPRRYTRSRSRSGSRGRGSDRNNPKPCKILGVFGLNYSTNSRDLERHFTRYGNVDKVDLITDNQGRSRGFGFITFESVDDARRARSAMTDKEFHGRRIRVDYSVSKGPHGRTPGQSSDFGQYMGSGRGRDSRSPSPGGARRRRSPSPRRRSRSPKRRYSRSPSPARKRRYSRSVSPRRRD